MIASTSRTGLGRFALAYPDIRLELAIDDVPADIVAFGFDVSITLDEFLERRLRSL